MPVLRPGLPWLPRAGTSLQLIDPRQDNWRAGNWSMSQTNDSGPPPPQWQYVTLTGTAPRPILLICMHNSPGDVYIDDLKLVAGSVPGGRGQSRSEWRFRIRALPAHGQSRPICSGSAHRAPLVKHSGNSSLHVVATSGRHDSMLLSIWQENTAAIVTNNAPTP